LFCNDELYAIVRSAKLGQVNLSPVLDQLRTWIIREYGLGFVHVLFDHVEGGPPPHNPRLTVILETDADYDSWHLDHLTVRPKIVRRVLDKFEKLAQAEPETYDTDGIFLVVENFSDAALNRACSNFLFNDAIRVVSEFEMGQETSPIWRIDGFSRTIVVFFYTDKDIRRNTENGACAKIAKRCLEGIKPYDEFGYLTKASFRLKFDSKENLDRNYKGSLFYYWR